MFALFLKYIDVTVPAIDPNSGKQEKFKTKEEAKIYSRNYPSTVGEKIILSVPGW